MYKHVAKANFLLTGVNEVSLCVQQDLQRLHVVV